MADNKKWINENTARIEALAKRLEEASYTDVSDTTATANDVLSGKVFYGKDGVKTTGTLEAGSGGDNIFQPNPTWWNIEKILEEDTDTEYKYKAIYLIYDSSDTEQFSNISKWTNFQKIKTSDGSEYLYSNYSDGAVVKHTWNKELDKPCYVNGKVLYKTRYYMILSKTYLQLNPNKVNVLYAVISNASATNGSGMGGFKGNNSCYEYKILELNQGYSGFRDCFRENRSLRRIIINNIVPYGSVGGGMYTSGMFYGCFSIEQILGLDLKYFIDTSYNDGGSQMFYNCYNLRDLEIKNIPFSITIGSGTTYGHKLSLESLINTIKELWDKTGDTEKTYKLTMGTANTAKLTDIYVKLVTITDDMRAEDEYIDNKKPFEVCESTDEGAMTIQEYVTSKGWQLA